MLHKPIWLILTKERGGLPNHLEKETAVYSLRKLSLQKKVSLWWLSKHPSFLWLTLLHSFWIQGSMNMQCGQSWYKDLKICRKRYIELYSCKIWALQCPANSQFAIAFLLGNLWFCKPVDNHNSPFMWVLISVA